MKFLLTVLGLAFLVIAAIYYALPAEQLPAFFPGHEAGVSRIHVKHGMAASAAGIVLILLGWVMGRRR